jgi:sugar lactone lactonase YvrE
MTMKTARAVPGIILALTAWCLVGTAAAPPTLTFQKMIGDLRGKFLPGNLQSVAVDDTGTCYLLCNTGSVTTFDPTGKYVGTQKIALRWPPTYRYLCAAGSRVFSGDAGDDYPWIYSPERVGSDPGRFLHPSQVAPEPASRQVYVADTDNSRVQRFAPDNTDTPNLVLPLPAKPLQLAVRGTALAVVTDDHLLSWYDLSGADPVLVATLKIGTGVQCLAVGPGQTLVVAWNYGQIRRYALVNGALVDGGFLAHPAMEDWPRLYPAAVALTVGPEGQIWFPTDIYGKLLSLDPATDTLTDRGVAPLRAVCLGFGPNGLLYAGGYVPAGTTGPSLPVLQLPALTKVGAVPQTGDLYDDPPGGMPVWGLLPDDDGGVYVRILEHGYQKDAGALNIKKVYPDGTVKPWVDFGQLYGKRTTFHPYALHYAMAFDSAHNIVVTAFALQAVMKISPDGKTIWEASADPQGGADKVEFGDPRDLTLDSAGNIWIVDGAKNKLVCLSPEGKLLLTYGGPGGLDDLSGEGFDMPSGVATATVGGVEYLYVGDAGNNRLIKYELDLP